MDNTVVKTFDEQWPDLTGKEPHDAIGIVWDYMPEPTYEETYFETMQNDADDFRSKSIRAANIGRDNPLDKALWETVDALEALKHECSNRRDACLITRIQIGIERYNEAREAAKVTA